MRSRLRLARHLRMGNLQSKERLRDHSFPASAQEHGWHVGAPALTPGGVGEGMRWGRRGAAGRALPWHSLDVSCGTAPPSCKARQRPFVLVRQNSAAPKPGLGALGAPGAARQLGAAQHSAAQASETPGPGNASASKYCSSFSLSGEIKKKREPSFLECNLPPATRSHVN